MSFATFDFDIDRVMSSGQLFSDAIESDPWVVFHGTSDYNAETIEHVGFKPNSSAVSSAQIRSVVSLYERMKWCGAHGGGFAALKPFSLDGDFHGTDVSYLYFARASSRSLLYATRDYAGGEKLRALRYAFRDLDMYLHDPAIRAEHWNQMKQEYQFLAQRNAHPDTLRRTAPVEFDLNLLEQELSALSGTRVIAEEASRRHNHGIVYALRTMAEDVEFLSNHGGMGIVSLTILPPSRIIAKAIVPPGFIWTGSVPDTRNSPKRGSGGIMELLRARQNSQSK